MKSANTNTQASTQVGALDGSQGAAQVDASSALTITSVRPSVHSGGYPTLSWGWSGLYVEFDDTTPVPTGTDFETGQEHPTRYEITATTTDPATGEQLTFTKERVLAFEGQGATELGDNTMPIGATYEVVISEYDGDTLVESSPPASHTLEIVGHPDCACPFQLTFCIHRITVM